MNTSSVNNETVSKPAENTFQPSHVGFIVFYAKREETNSKLDIEEGEHQQEVVILTSQKIIWVCWMIYPHFLHLILKVPMCRRTPAFCSVFTRHRLSQNHPHTKAVLLLSQSLLDLFISLKCALSSAMSQIRQRTTWRRFATSRVAVAWCHLRGRLPSVFFADIDRYNKGKWQHLTAAAMQCGSLYNCSSPDLQSQGVAKCRLVSRREASVWRSSCTPEGKTRTPHHV